MKRILLIASTPLANDGLTQIEMDTIEFNQDVIQFEVACGFGFDNSYGKKLKDKDIICHILPHKRIVFAYMFAIFKLVKQKKYDSVYIHGNSAMMFMEAIPSKLAGTKVITHCHNTKSNYPLVHYMVKPVFNLAVDEKIGCSSWASKWAYCGKNIITIVNGVDIQKFKYNENKRYEMREKLSWEKCKVIGHIGRFSKQKNHKKLIQIFNEIYKNDHKARLLLIGDGELRKEINEQIRSLRLSDVVCMIKETDCPQDYMQAMDIMVVPSLFEGLCLVAIEAQANGLPVLIDNNFTPETVASDLVEVIELSETNGKWADMVEELIKLGRQDVTEQLLRKKMDKVDMMKRLQEVLLR